MFDPAKPEKKKRNASLAISFVLHCAVIYALISRAPIFVQPSSVAWGNHGESTALVYFSRNEGPQAEQRKLTLPAKAKSRAERKRLYHPDTLRAGTETGSLDRGPATGSEAAPALPLIFPDPAIYPWQLANGLHGDVVIEVTIDVQGNVTDTRLLQSLKQDIDEKCVDTVKSWRFKPATLDGIAIASRQDVHFHFPS